MTQHVTFETAARLKDAGFPQPEQPQRGQVWYTCFGQTMLVIYERKDRCDYHLLEKDRVYFDRIFENGEVFAPTAVDILEQLPECFSLEKCGSSFNCCGDREYMRDCPVWWPLDIEHREDGSIEFINDNPAEACAKAWLTINKK